MAITLNHIKDIIRKSESDIRAMGVKEIYVFGSVARGTSRDSSDVDCFVVFEDTVKVTLLTLARLQIFLEKKFNVPVDLGTKRSLHRNLRDQILQEAVRVA